MIERIGLWLLIALAFNMWAWMSVMRSDARIVARLIWSVILVCLPGIGFIAWYLLGPREARA